MAQAPRPPLPPLGLGVKDEFTSLIGDRQADGSGTHISALARNPTAPYRPPAGKAAQAAARAVSSVDRQVLSVFDTRPIDGFDFALFGISASSDPQDFLVEIEVPNGFVCVLRRVEFVVFPPYAGSGLTDPLTFQLTRNGSGIQSNAYQGFGIIESAGWDTHQVFGYWEKPGVFITPGDGGNYDYAVRFFGTFLLAKNIPPGREIGSEPLRTRP
jgi:hypothetical protein